MRIECPICEHHFEIDASDGREHATLTCGACQKTFRFNPSLAQEGRVSSEPAQDVLRPERIKSLPEDSLPPNDDQQLHMNMAAANSHAAFRRRKRSVTKQVWIVALLVVVAIGLLAVIPFAGQLSEMLNGADPVQTVADQTTGDSTEPILPPENEPRNEDSNPDDDVAIQTKDVPDETPAIEYSEPVDFNMLDDKSRLWDRVRPHLLQLSSETPFGNRQATGVMIDSRGWVVTSYRTMQGAREIKVTRAQSSPNLSDKQPLTDLVRGVVASDIDNDLVILLVNRRFVVSFQELDLVAEDRIVASQFLAHCVPPTDRYPWPVSECRIKKRSKRSQLGTEESDRLGELGFKDESTNWIVYEHHSPLDNGAPLVTQDGKIAGMTVQTVAHERDSGTSYAVPATKIEELRASVIGDQVTALPLPSVADIATRQWAATAGQSVDAGPPAGNAVHGNPTGPLVLPEDSLRRILSVNLNQAGRECQGFGWLPDDKERVGHLLLFAEHLIAARQVVSEEPDDATDTPVLRQQIEYWTEQLQQQLLASGLSEVESQKALNQQVRDELNAPMGKFVACGSIHHGVMISPELDLGDEFWDETITLNITGSDQRLITHNGADWPVMRPETNWLIFGERINGRVNVSGDEGQPDEICELARVYFVFSIDKPPE